MKIICYAFQNKNKELEAPFLEYLEKYAIQDRDSDKIRNLKLKQSANIEAHLKYLLEHKGSYDLPPLAQKYKNTHIGILKIKESSNLVRIAYFTKQGNDIILLDAMDKPKLYEKGQKQKVDKMIQRFLDKSEEFRQDYFKQNISLPLNF